MLSELKEQVCKANIELVKHGLVLFTWGNVSGIDGNRELMVIKPSGVSYEKLKPSDMVILDLKGKVIEGKLKPSSDTPTHIELYRAFPNAYGIAHTHATYATAWAQAGKSIPIIGTTHADYFSQDIPCTNDMSEEQIKGDYEKETGLNIIQSFKDLNPVHVPGVLVKNHGPFTWGKTVTESVINMVILEEVAKMASLSLSINPEISINQELINKHFSRKHGKDAYYGQ